MKRKLLSTIMATACAVTCAFGLVACNDDGEHTHDYGTEWKTNATHHWHECKNDGCDAKEKDKAAHADNNNDGKCDECNYDMGGGSQTVAVESITLNKSTLTLDIEGEETLTVNYTPATATDKTVTWSSSAPAIASVDNTGKVTALAAGTATITAKTANNKTATCAVTVNTATIAVESITLNKSTLTLDIDGEETLTVNYTPATATDKTVTWSSSAPAIASVDNTGKVTALASGTATITAKTANNKTATCAVTVNTATIAVESITLNKSTLTLDIEGEETLTVNYTPATATDKTVTWSSSAPAIASVDNTGKVTALATGTATITATTANNKTATCDITVNAPQTVLTENTDFSTLVSEQISEEQWLTAFDNSSFSNATVKHTNDYYERNVYWKVQTDDDNKYVYLDSTQSGERMAGYFTIESGNKYAYMEQDGTYTREDVSSTGEVFDNWYMSYTMSCITFGNYYSDFTYDAQTGAYRYNGTGLTSNSPLEYNMGNNSYSDITVKIINGKIAYISCKRVDISDGLFEFFVYDYGTTDVTPPTDFVENDTGTSGFIQGTYYMVVTSETGWTPTQDFAIAFNNDGTCTMESAGTYVIENNVITLSVGADTYYAVIDGKILWLFENKEDTSDISNTIQHFYNGTEISNEDRAKMVKLFGEGIITSKPDKPE